MIDVSKPGHVSNLAIMSGRIEVLRLPGQQLSVDGCALAHGVVVNSRPVEEFVADMLAARKCGDTAEHDRIRSALKHCGVSLKETPNRITWTVG